jgi:hypothetical protein
MAPAPGLSYLGSDVLLNLLVCQCISLAMPLQWSLAFIHLFGTAALSRSEVLV